MLQPTVQLGNALHGKRSALIARLSSWRIKVDSDPRHSAAFCEAEYWLTPFGQRRAIKHSSTRMKPLTCSLVQKQPQLPTSPIKRIPNPIRFHKADQVRIQSNSSRSSQSHHSQSARLPPLSPNTVSNICFCISGGSVMTNLTDGTASELRSSVVSCRVEE